MGTTIKWSIVRNSKGKPVRTEYYQYEGGKLVGQATSHDKGISYRGKCNAIKRHIDRSKETGVKFGSYGGSRKGKIKENEPYELKLKLLDEKIESIKLRESRMREIDRSESGLYTAKGVNERLPQKPMENFTGVTKVTERYQFGGVIRVIYEQWEKGMIVGTAILSPGSNKLNGYKGVVDKLRKLKFTKEITDKPNPSEINKLYEAKLKANELITNQLFRR